MRMSPDERFDMGQDDVHILRLADKIIRPRFQGTQHHRPVFLARKDQQPELLAIAFAPLTGPAAYFEPVHSRHDDVHHGDMECTFFQLERVRRPPTWRWLLESQGR